MSLTTTCIKRIAKDVSDINKNNLVDNGIFYIHNEDNITEGYALIIGPEDTVYENGYYFFKFYFPNEYPYVPPKVVFCNYDKSTNTRFHPNLYRNGKTCLSLLNTWKGEGWTSCQNIRSILLTLSSILTSNPLIEEPGITITHRDNIPYNKIITYKNYEISIINVIKFIDNKSKDIDLEEFDIFSSVIKDTFENKKFILHENLLDKIKKFPHETSNHASIYNMDCTINYKLLLKEFEKLI